jgi:hypothetical protein
LNVKLFVHHVTGRFKRLSAVTMTGVLDGNTDIFPMEYLLQVYGTLFLKFTLPFELITYSIEQMCLIYTPLPHSVSCTSLSQCRSTMFRSSVKTGDFFRFLQFCSPPLLPMGICRWEGFCWRRLSSWVLTPPPALRVSLYVCTLVAVDIRPRPTSGRAGLQPLGFWDCGFESRRGMGVCLLWVLCDVR